MTESESVNIRARAINIRSTISTILKYQEHKNMGIVFGVTGVKEPLFSVMARTSAGYDLRQYNNYFIAQVSQKQGGGDSNGFNILARYIGVFGKPENEGATVLAMTAPVLTDAASDSSHSSERGTKLSMTVFIFLLKYFTQSILILIALRGQGSRLD